jgi:hypothetical protein
MAERALGLYRDMLSEGLVPDAMTYRHLFKALRQACRFQELVDLAKTVDRELLVSSDRVGVPLITACFKVGDHDRAGDLLALCGPRAHPYQGRHRCPRRAKPPHCQGARFLTGQSLVSF